MAVVGRNEYASPRSELYRFSLLALQMEQGIAGVGGQDLELPLPTQSEKSCAVSHEPLLHLPEAIEKC